MWEDILERGVGRGAGLGAGKEGDGEEEEALLSGASLEEEGASGFFVERLFLLSATLPMWTGNVRTTSGDFRLT